MSWRSDRSIRLIWAGAVIGIIVGSLVPELSPPAQFGLDKIIHIIVFASIAAVPGVFAKNVSTLVIISGALALIAGGIEILQSMIPGRTGSLADYAASTVGVVCGTVVALKIFRAKPRAGNGAGTEEEIP